MLMDVTAAAKNRSAAVRATPRQIEALRNAFSESTATSKDLLKRLSEQTGLSIKWIVAWYARQRRKRRTSGDTSSDPATLPEDIADFKKEYRELVLVDTAKDGNTRNDEKRNVDPPLEKRRRGRPPKHKVKAQQHHEESVLSSIQPSSPSSALLNIDPTLSVSQDGFCSSSFMRPIAPRMHLPSSVQQHQVPVSLNSMPSFYGRPGLLNPSVSPWALNYNYFPGSSPLQIAHQPAAYATIRDQNHPPMNYVRNLPDKALHSNVQNESPPFGRVGHSRRPIARHIPYSPRRTTQWPAASLPQLPLFTRNVLSFSRSLASPHADVPSVKNSTADSVTPHDQPARLDEDSYISSLDPLKAPLKHLTILRLDSTDDMSPAFHTADLMIDRLLDEQLAVDDPFQATMSLVFLSRLGLSWDYE